jgi:hypothetical protein
LNPNQVHKRVATRVALHLHRNEIARRKPCDGIFATAVKDLCIIAKRHTATIAIVQPQIKSAGADIDALYGPDHFGHTLGKARTRKERNLFHAARETSEKHNEKEKQRQHSLVMNYYFLQMYINERRLNGFMNGRGGFSRIL